VAARHRRVRAEHVQVRGIPMSVTSHTHASPHRL
jgi:hypothetical protein